MPEMPKKLCQFSASFIRAVDKARGEEGFAAFIERELWRLAVLKKTGVKRQERVERGKWER